MHVCDASDYREGEEAHAAAKAVLEAGSSVRLAGLDVVGFAVGSTHPTPEGNYMICARIPSS